MGDARTILITGGAGFIGSALVRAARAAGYRVVVLDKLTYAGDRWNLEDVLEPGACELVVGDIGDGDLVGEVLRSHDVEAVLSLAAESHVDNSISHPPIFIETNISKVSVLLTACADYRDTLSATRAEGLRLVHVSTDEVFGTLGPEGAFTEVSRYDPRSPYAASKAASDHLVRAWSNTYGLPAIITHCGNNFGPRQHREKLIPTMIAAALNGTGLPVYGDGTNIRDWIYVDDHCTGLMLALEKGRPGEAYCFGAGRQLANIDLVRRVCALLDERVPKSDGAGYASQITFVNDRPGHDFRYAVDWRKARDELGFAPVHDFAAALAQTVDWYLAHRDRLRLAQGATA